MNNTNTLREAGLPDGTTDRHCLSLGGVDAGNWTMPMATKRSGNPSAHSQFNISSHIVRRPVEDSIPSYDADSDTKKRRAQRACDICRRKKVRCDGPQPTEDACSHCAAHGYECTFVDVARKRGPPRNYVEATQARMVKMEQLIASLAPGIDFTDRIGERIRRPNEEVDMGPEGETSALPLSKADLAAADAKSDLQPGLHGPGTTLCSQMLCAIHEEAGIYSKFNLMQSSDDDSEDDIAFIESSLGNVNLQQPSSTTVDDVGHERLLIGADRRVQSAQRNSQVPKYVGKANAVHSLPLIQELSSRNCVELGVYPQSARSEFWGVPSGLLDQPGDPDLMSSAWPDEDLGIKLIDAYFGRSNRDYPVVNEALFRFEYVNRPELRNDPGWLALSFGIFMVGSASVSDERILAFANDPHSRGMQWWQAAKTLSFRNSSQQNPVNTIQVLLLATIFQMSIQISASTSWHMLGNAVRLLLDIGAHRRHAAKKLSLSLLQEETYRRIFWVAYSLDRAVASNLGRPLMLQDEDIDLELPMEVDDEHLFSAALARCVLTQPTCQPAITSGFVHSLRLDEIIGFILKTVYALQRVKSRFGRDSGGWDARIVTEIDSMLSDWLDAVPSHLRYDAHELNDDWFIQSSMLYLKYHYCQILAHRPFIRAKTGGPQTSVFNFPELAICTDAARSVSHLLRKLKDRKLQNQMGIPVALWSAPASVILLIVVWGAKRDNDRVSSSASSDLCTLIDVYRTMESRWQFAGRAVDILESNDQQDQRRLGGLIGNRLHYYISMDRHLPGKLRGESCM